MSVRAAFLASVVLMDASAAFAQAPGRRHVGFVKDPRVFDGVQHLRPHMRGDTAAALPPRVSLRDFMPGAGDQGGYPTDASWAVAYGALTCMQSIARHGVRRPSLDSLAFSPGFLSALVAADHHTTCEQGLSIADALEATLRVGAVRLRDFPVECDMAPPDWLKARAAANRISAYFKLFDRDDPDKSGPVRRSLAENRPVVAALRFVPSFLDGDEVWRPSPAELGRTAGGLDTAVAVTVVGYDDRPGKGTFQLMASLGSRWGTNGFAEVSSGDFDRLCLQAFVMYADSTPVAGIAEAPSAEDSTQSAQDAAFAGTVAFLDEGQRPIPMVRDHGLYRTAGACRNNQVFRIRLQLGNAGYVYAFAVDSAGPTPTVIFPDRITSLKNYVDQDSVLLIPDPSGRSYCLLDSTEGTDFVCLLFTRREIDVKSFCHGMELVAGSLAERIAGALNGDCVPENEIRDSPGDDLRWWTPNRERSCIALVFALNHTLD